MEIWEIWEIWEERSGTPTKWGRSGTPKERSGTPKERSGTPTKWGRSGTPWKGPDFMDT
jgi:hypothetical protein